jgi:phenylacetate-CoA ligase
MIDLASPYLQPEIETMPRAELAALQEKRVVSLVRHAYEKSACYREAWQAAGVVPDQVASVADFQKLVPLLGKSDLVKFRDRTGDPYCGILCVEPHEVDNIGTSSGTTSEPMPLVELVAGAVPFASSVRDMWGAGLRPGDRVIHVMATQRGPQDRVNQAIGCIPIMVNVRPGADWSVVFDMIRRHQPSHIYLLGPMLPELDRLSEDVDLAEIFSCVKFAVVSGEPLGARMRRKLTEEWGLELYDVTGTADTGVAWECSAHDGYHVWEDFVFAECLDPKTGAPVADGEPGELVCTALANQAWPLIRHRSGDLVRFDRSPCTCGRTHLRFHLLGRISDRVTIGGRDVLPMQVWRLIEQFDETAAAVFQIVVPAGGTDELRIRVGYNARRTTSVPDLEARIAAAIEAELGLVPVLELSEEAELQARSRSGIKLPRLVRE